MKCSSSSSHQPALCALRIVTVISLLVMAMFCGCNQPRPFAVSAPPDPKSVLRGYHLVEGLAACGYCHSSAGAPRTLLEGGVAWHDRYGAVLSPNITPSREGIGTWETREIIAALRQNVRPDGELIWSDAHSGYEWISDQDLLSIVSYLRTVEHSPKQVEVREVSFIERNTTGFFDAQPSVRGYVPAILPRFEREYGKYLVDHVARCQFCHTAQAGLLEGSGYLDGGRVIRLGEREFETPPLTSSSLDGLGDWSEQQIIAYLVSGQTPSAAGAKLPPDPQNGCPVGWFANAQESDLKAIARYLKSLP